MAATTLANNSGLSLGLNSPYADVVLRSSDGTDYRMSKATLSQASPFFEQMFSLPQLAKDSDSCAKDDNEERVSLPIIPFTEPASVLDVLLRFCIPRPPPKLNDFVTIFHVLKAAKKYELDWAFAAVSDALGGVVGKDPVRSYVMARHFELKDATRQAAIHCLRLTVSDIIDCDIGELECINGRDFQQLLRYRRKCRDAVSERLLPRDLLRDFAASFSCSRCDSPNPKAHRTGTRMVDTKRWQDYMTRVTDPLKDSTWEGTIRLQDALEACQTCDTCRAVKIQGITRFTEKMASEVRKIVSQVRLMSTIALWDARTYESLFARSVTNSGGDWHKPRFWRGG